jgi:hypothetical protein
VNPRFRKYLVCGVALLVVLILGFVVGCGSSATTTTAAAPATTTTAGETETTAASAGGTSGTIVVKGAVDNPVTLTVADLQKMTVVKITAEHPKLGPTDYSGVRFSDLLAIVKVKSTATLVDIAASDGFMGEIALADIQKTPDALLAIGDDGKLSVVMPGMSGKAWVKDAVTMEFK